MISQLDHKMREKSAKNRDGNYKRKIADSIWVIDSWVLFYYTPFCVYHK